MAQPIWNPSTKHYSFLEKDNPKDRVEVEVGDAEDSSTLFPQVKIKRWDNEVNSSIRLKHDTIPGNITYSDDGNKITWIKKQGNKEWKAVFYHRDDLDEGGFEFEIHLPAKPPVNYLEFTVNTKELNWIYQPALTPEEIAEGSVRPDNVVGSYAVYHKTKGGVNRADGMEYKTGKAFHVYRPHVVDANGNETWGTLELDEVNGILKISVDQTYLNNAVYPVVVDPTFGYTTAGATGNRHSASNIRSSRNTNNAPGSNGTVDKFTIYGGVDSGGTGKIRPILYINSSLARVDFGSEVTFTNNGSTSPTWNNFNLTGASITSGTQYDLAYWQTTAVPATHLVWVYSDSVAGSALARDNTAYHSTNNPPDPFTVNSSLSDVRYSVYATYTASGGAVTPNGKMTLNSYWGT